MGTTTANYGYVEYLPAGYVRGSGPKWPLIIFLHGLGECGNGKDQLMKVVNHGPMYEMSTYNRHYPAIILSPQSGYWWDGGAEKTFLEWVIQNYDVDLSRIYVTGLSMGGAGTLYMVREAGTRLAASVPVAEATQAANNANEHQMFSTVPTWMFQNVYDNTVTMPNNVNFFMNSMADYWGISYRFPTNVDYKTNIPAGYNPSQTMTVHRNGNTWEWTSGAGTTDANGQPYSTNFHMTVYPDYGHGGWDKAYHDEDMWTWLFCQQKN